jgi:2-polyprenyl-6-methoxyphenol hydroxylase-like FAD-dependent oxidoreductase
MTDESQRTSCCVVGAGPAGAMLSLLLARAGIPVTLLESHRDFDRDFRGDTIHPSTLEVLAQIGLAERLHELPHVKASAFRIVTPTGSHTMAVFSRLPTPFPYMMIMPQVRFLEFVTDEAKKYPHFKLLLGANVDRLIEEEGAVRGVGYRTAEGRGAVRAAVTIAADGRFSRVRKLAGLTPVSLSRTMEVIWFRLPRRPGDPHEAAGINVGRREVVAVLARTQEWQIGYVVPQGRFRELRAEGLEAFRESIVAVLPWLADRVALLADWSATNLLSVEGSQLTRWYLPGLLVIGDAAHVMLPVAGVGINCAIADAVEAVNVLAEPLRAGCVRDSDLAEIQKRRERITRIIQTWQTRIQEGMLHALETGQPVRPPLPLRVILRVPGLRNLPGRLAAFGVRRVRLQRPEEVPLTLPRARWHRKLADR